MPNKRDYYEVLGIAETADEAVIKKAYRRLAHKHHPDRNPEDPHKAEEKFKEVSEAYEVLKDPQKKQLYDQYGHNAPTGGFVSSDPFDMFSSFFGGPKRRGNRNSQTKVHITLENVLTGVEKDIETVRHFYCSTCKGIGGTGKVCMTCHGRGQIGQRHGFMEVRTTCSACRGKGTQITQSCPECKGKGNIPQKRSITINIPRGVTTGDILNASGEGDVIYPDRPPGDLLCQIIVEPHSVFERRDKDIMCAHEISFTDACCGTKIKVPVLGGKTAHVVIPPGTKAGSTFKLNNKGVPSVRDRRRGNQYVKIQIYVPQEVDDETRELLDKLAKKIKKG